MSSDFQATLAALHPMERLFVERYIVTRNGATAAIQAGYAPAHAAQQANRLKSRPKVREAIRLMTDRVTATNLLDAERVLQQLARKVFFDVRRLYDENGEVIPPHLLDDATAASVVEHEVREHFDQDGRLVGRTHKLKVPDNMPALSAAMRHLGLFERDNNQHSSAVVESVVDLMKLAAQNPLTPRQEAARPLKKR